jgi:hypothetical protein
MNKRADMLFDKMRQILELTTSVDGPPPERGSPLDRIHFIAMAAVVKNATLEADEIDAAKAAETSP